MERLSREGMERLERLAKLELSEKEREKARQEMEQLLLFVNQINELDTEHVKPLMQVLPMNNVVREDIITNEDRRQEMLFNAPKQSDGMFVVPQTTVSGNNQDEYRKDES